MVRVVDLMEAGPPYRRNGKARLVIEGPLPGESAFAFYDRAQERYIGPDSFVGEPHYFRPRSEDAPPGGSRRSYTFGPEVTCRLRRDGVFTIATRDGEIGDVACKVATLIEVGGLGTVTIDAGRPQDAGGAAGPTGADDTGSTERGATTGAAGTTGASGRTGNTGPSGGTGAAGATGAGGRTGNAATSGGTGATGMTGAGGRTGSTGPSGATGTTGAEGRTGNSGSGASVGGDRAKVGRVLAVLAAFVVVVFALVKIIPVARPIPDPDPRQPAVRSAAWIRCEALMAPSWDPASPGGREMQPTRSEAQECVGLCDTALGEASGRERGTIKFRLGRAQQIAGDRETARQTLAEALNLGSKAAAHALGNLYYNDRPPQYARAAENYRIGALAGIARSKASLAGLLAEGEGLDIDVAEASRLAREAADAGVGAGARVYGKLILDGKIAGSRAEACRWFQQAIEQGDVREARPLERRACR